jgi:hypothetical protein
VIRRPSAHTSHLGTSSINYRVEKYGARQYESELKAAGLSHLRPTLNDMAMLQFCPESHISSTSSRSVIATGSTADTVTASVSAADTRSNAANACPPPTAARQSRVALACKRCKRRKQRVRHAKRCLIQELWLKTV